jgi:hypothetical protein
VHYYRRLLLWFFLMAMPVFLLFSVLLAWSVQAPLAYRQTALGTAVVVGSLALFIGMLGLASELVLKSNWQEFDRLVVVDDRTGETLS